MCLLQFDICIKFFKSQYLLQKLHNKTQSHISYKTSVSKTQLTCFSGRFALVLVWNVNTQPTVYGSLKSRTLMIRELEPDILCSCRIRRMRVHWGHITDRWDGIYFILIPFNDRSWSFPSTRFSNLPPLKITFNLKTHHPHQHIRPWVSSRQIPQPSHCLPCQQHCQQSICLLLSFFFVNMQNINPTAGFFNNPSFRECIFYFGWTVMATTALLRCVYCVVTR